MTLDNPQSYNVIQQWSHLVTRSDIKRRCLSPKSPLKLSSVVLICNRFLPKCGRHNSAFLKLSVLQQKFNIFELRCKNSYLRHLYAFIFLLARRASSTGTVLSYCSAAHDAFFALPSVDSFKCFDTVILIADMSITWRHWKLLSAVLAVRCTHARICRPTNLAVSRCWLGVTCHVLNHTLNWWP